jgi:hypothetical protein
LVKAFRVSLIIPPRPGIVQKHRDHPKSRWVSELRFHSLAVGDSATFFVFAGPVSDLECAPRWEIKYGFRPSVATYLESKQSVMPKNVAVGAVRGRNCNPDCHPEL